mgnify:CR=1 FL=1
MSDFGRAWPSWSRPAARLEAGHRGAAPAARRAAGVVIDASPPTANWRAGRARPRGRPVARRAGGRGCRGRRGRPRPAPDVGRGGRLRHDHLHLGHHRLAEGCEITHGNLLRQRAQRGPRAAVGDLRHARRVDPALPSLAHSFARLIEVARHRGGWPCSATPPTWPTLLPELATFQPTFLLAVPRVFEKVYNGAEQQASESGIKGAIFHAAARTAIAWSSALGTHDTASADGPGPGAAATATPSSTGWSTAKLRAAVGGRARALGVRRCGTRGPAQPLLPRCRDHHRRGIRRSPRPPPPPR